MCYNFWQGDVVAKIKLKACLIGPDDEYIFEGFGILNNNRITYFEDDVNVKIDIFDDYFLITRKTKEYTLKINLSTNNNSTYNIKEIGLMDVKAKVLNIIIEQGYLYCNYILFVNNVEIGNFKYSLTYNIE